MMLVVMMVIGVELLMVMVVFDLQLITFNATMLSGQP